MIENEMSLADMKAYTGTNPKPADFDEYWEAALGELDTIDPKVNLEEADFKVPFAKCYHMHFTGVKGARVYSKLIRPVNKEVKGPALLTFHGYSGNSGGWTDAPTKLCYAAMGFTVAAMDCRGQGGRSLDSGTRLGWSYKGHIVRGVADDASNLLYRDIFLDTALLARIVMQLDGVDPQRVGVTGQSQGGGLALACASLVPEIARVAPLYPFLCDYKRAWQLNCAESGYIEIAEYIKRFDPRHERIEELFTKLGYIDVHHLAARIKGELFMGTGLSDAVCPPSTQFAAYNAVQSKKTLNLYPDYAHERLADHLDDVFRFMSTL